MPIDAGIGISSAKDYKFAVTEAVSQAKINLKQKDISLAIVFTTPEFASPYSLKAIRSLIGDNIPLIGTSSNALIAQDGIINHGIAIALINIQGAYFTIGRVKNVLENLEVSGESLGKQLLFGMKGGRKILCLLFSDGQIIDNHPLLKGLQQRLGVSFPIVGATSASKDGHSNKTNQYFNQEVLNSSIVGLLLGGKVNFGLGIKHGWEPIGKPHRINLSDKFIIKEIEKKPAVTLYQDYFAKDIPELKQELRHISRLYPMGINISGEEEYLLRNILSIGDDGSLVCRGDVPPESEVRLMIGTKESCLTATQEAAKDAKQTLAIRTSPKQESIKIIFVFNSVSRLSLLGRQITEELKIINSHFANTPIVGLCTYGEQGPLRTTDFAGKTYCHNQTITILAIS